MAESMSAYVKRRNADDAAKKAAKTVGPIKRTELAKTVSKLKKG